MGSSQAPSSLFITFEGGEGCGKSTQARALYKRLSRLGIPVISTHEPGGTVLGNEIRRCLKRSREGDISPEAELLRFAASRAQLAGEVIQPALKGGQVVICDRYADSTTAYQGYGRGIDLSITHSFNAIATQGLQADLTLLLDIPPKEGLTRKGSKRADRFEQEELAFHQKVREGYLQMAAAEPQRWMIIDAMLPKERIEQLIWERVAQLLKLPSGK